MLSRKEGRNYVILRQGEKFPSKVNKKRTDTKLEKLQSALKTIKNELQDAYDNDPELYHLVQEEVFSRITDYDGKGKFGKQKADDKKFYQGLIKKLEKKKVNCFLLEYTRDKALKEKIKEWCKKNKVDYYISEDVNL